MHSQRINTVGHQFGLNIVVAIQRKKLDQSHDLWDTKNSVLEEISIVSGTETRNNSILLSYTRISSIVSNNVLTADMSMSIVKNFYVISSKIH